MKDFGEICYLILLAVLGVFINGFVFMKMWLWFIYPTFTAVQLGFVHATGIMVIFTFILHKKKEDGAKDIKGITELYLGQVFTTALTLGIAYLLHLFL